MRLTTLRFRNTRALSFFEEHYRGNTDHVLFEAALMDFVRRGVISGGKAAELLGVSRWELPELLADHDVYTVAYAKEVLDTESATLRRALKEA